MEVISFGGGVNSTAMAIRLINEGWQGKIIFADTGTEWPETYCFMDYFEREWLVPRGFEIICLGGDYRALGHGRDSRPLIQFCEDYAVTPFLGTRWCTQGWKTDPIDAWCQEHSFERQLVAIASDESWRQKGRICPLIDASIDREGCIRIIEVEGLSVPHKSGCYICPMQRYTQWRELHENHPELFERAARLEDLSTQRRKSKDGKRTILEASGRHSLREMEIMFKQGNLFDDATLDGLLRHRACVCGL